MGIDILRDEKMWEWKDLYEERAYHASVNVICFESCFLHSSGVILCCVRGSFPLHFMGGWFPEWIVSFLIG